MIRLAGCLVLAGCVMLAACSSETSQSAGTPATGDTPSDTTDSLTSLYAEAAQRLVVEFQRRVKSALLNAMNEGGAVSAISVCGTKAEALGDSASGPGWQIRRVSDRFRNPANRADSAQLAILARFADTVDFIPYLSWWSEQDSSRVFYFYEPIRVNQFCLNCHGDIQTLAPGVYEALKRDYPMDRALGYRAGDLRGMFVVEAQWPEGEAFARRLVSDSL